MNRGRHARFAPMEAAKAVAAIPLDPRRFSIRCEDDREAVVDLGDWSRPRLAAEMAMLFHEYVRRMGPTPIARTVRRRVLHLRQFWTFLDSRDAPAIGLGEIDATLINAYEGWLAQNGGGLVQQRHLLGIVIGLLRLAVEMRPGTLTQETVVRLTYVAHGEYGVSRPRDAYSSGVAQRLRDAARAQIETARQRIVVGEALPAVPDGIAIGSRLHDHYSAVIAWIVRHGQIDTRHPVMARFVNLANHTKQDSRLEPLHAGFHLFRLDLIGFIVLLSLETGMEMECLFRLKADCLRNPAKGYVEIEYYKRRARGSEWKRLRVRDGSSGTPGGLIRLAIALTEKARQHLGTDRLWALWTIDGLRLPTDEAPQGAQAFVRHHGLVDDEGAPLRLSLSRLRKTHKAEWYRRTKGQLEHFAVGHSIKVAARHYAEIPALRPVHEQTIADALGDALEAALKPTILLSDLGDDVQGACAQPSISDTAATASNEELWLARCSDFFASPFGPDGEACPTPFWGCLECENAAITVRKLPALIAFQSFMADQRETLGADEWAGKFGRAWARIDRQILPAFPARLVEAARIEAAAAGPELLYLPAEMRA